MGPVSFPKEGPTGSNQPAGSFSSFTATARKLPLRKLFVQLPVSSFPEDLALFLQKCTLPQSVPTAI